MRILRAESYKRMPWKNGGGETTEIAVSPDNAGLADFDWRVSMARVAGDGPFSAFPDIDRTLSILEGAGIVLAIEGREAKPLTLSSEPHSFPADVATSANLIDGTVIDFNIMSRRGRIAHSVQRLHEPTTSSSGAVRLVLCSKGWIEVAVGGRPERLGPRDSAIFDAEETAGLAPGRDAEFYLVEFRAP